MAVLTMKDAKIGYDDDGTGTPLLFLHAFPLDRTMWNVTAREIAAHARVLRMDARGFGESSPAGEILSMQMIAEDAVRLLDHRRVDRVVVCGLSMGGYAALAMSRRYADRMMGLILCDTRAAADSEEARAGRFRLIDRVRDRGSAALEETMLERLLGDTTRTTRPEVVSAVRASIHRATPESVIAALRGLAGRADASELLAGLALPVMLLCGEEDVITPPEEMRALLKSAPQGRYVEIARAGHLANMENPAMFHDAVVDMLGNLDL